MSDMIRAALCFPRVSVTSADAAIALMAGVLVVEGHVTESFAAATQKREKRSPTGLPFAPHPVALPHAEPEHVTNPAIAIATLAAPVKFRQMGSPQTSLDVSLIVMPVLSAKEQAAASLARVIELLQDDAFRADLIAAADAESLASLFSMKWGKG